MNLPSDALEQDRAFGGVIDVLEAIGAVYAIWGGLAVVAYGEPRFTMDMDVLLSPSGFLGGRFVQRLQESHYHVDPVLLARVMLESGAFNVIHLGTHIKSDFYVPGQDPMLLAALRDRVYLPFDELRRAAYVPIQAAIATKLRAYVESESTRHLDDIASILRVQGGRVSAAELDRTAARLGVFGVWRSLWEHNRLP
jgi:hypothetical protein